MMHAPAWPTNRSRLHGLIATGGLSEGQNMEQIADLFHQSVQTGSSAPLLTLSLQHKSKTEASSVALCFQTILAFS